MFQFFFSPLAGGDILHNAQTVQRSAVSLSHHRRRQEAPDDISSLRHEPFLRTVGGDLAAEQQLQAFNVLPNVFRMRHSVDGEATQFCLGISHHCTKRVVHLDDLAMQGHHHHSDRSLFKNLSELLNTGAKRLLNPHALRLVNDESLDLDQFVLLVEFGADIAHNVHRRVVFSPHHHLIIAEAPMHSKDLQEILVRPLTFVETKAVRIHDLEH